MSRQEQRDAFPWAQQRKQKNVTTPKKHLNCRKKTCRVSGFTVRGIHTCNPPFKEKIAQVIGCGSSPKSASGASNRFSIKPFNYSGTDSIFCNLSEVNEKHMKGGEEVHGPKKKTKTNKGARERRRKAGDSGPSF